MSEPMINVLEILSLAYSLQEITRPDITCHPPILVTLALSAIYQRCLDTPPFPLELAYQLQSSIPESLLPSHTMLNISTRPSRP